jgi:hypothetical protein
VRQNDSRSDLRGLLHQTFRRCRDQLSRLFKVLEALRVVPENNLLDHALNNSHNRLR